MFNWLFKNEEDKMMDRADKQDQLDSEATALAHRKEFHLVRNRIQVTLKKTRDRNTAKLDGLLHDEL